MTERTQTLKKRIAQLELKSERCGNKPQAQRKRIAQKCGYEFLSLVDSEVNCKVFAIDIAQELVVQDEDGNTISETDSSLVDKIIEVSFTLD